MSLDTLKDVYRFWLHWDSGLYGLGPEPLTFDAAHWCAPEGYCCGRRKYRCPRAREHAGECKGSKAYEARPPLACSPRVSPLIYMVSCSMYTVTEIKDENRWVRLYETHEQHQGLGMSKKGFHFVARKRIANSQMYRPRSSCVCECFCEFRRKMGH